MSPQRTSATFIEEVLDPDSFESWDQPPATYSWSTAYAAELLEARASAGTDEAVVTGKGTINGRDVAVIVSEFAFLAGSIGQATARRVIEAFRRATREGLPVLAAPRSGGTRMQEGTPAFIEMIGIGHAVLRHKAAGLPYLVHLGHPTTGGVLASWGSLGHVTYAEPHALVGFLGPRVVETLTGEPMPADVQTSENLADRGVIDKVVPQADLADVVGRLLAILEPKGNETDVQVTTKDIVGEGSPPVWESITRTRRDDRPGLRDLMVHGTIDCVELHGTGAGEDDPGIVLAICTIGSQACLLVGQDRIALADAPLSPAALRKAQRGIRLAGELGLPLVTVVDTGGAELSSAAENGAMAGEIARTMAALESATVPRVAVLLGQGCGGGALALLPADSVIAAENSWLSPLPLEGASIIVHRHPGLAPEMAVQQRVGAQDLVEAGIVDVLIPEGRGLPLDPKVFALSVAAACVEELQLLRKAKPALRLRPAPNALV